MSANQSIEAKIQISGPQPISIRSNDAGEGSYITVITGLVMMTLFDTVAADTYAGAWLHPIDYAKLLPAASAATLQQQRLEKGAVRISQMAAAGPSLSVRAHGLDTVRHGFDRRTAQMYVKIGGITWTVCDQQAYNSMATAYTRVLAMAQLILTAPRPSRG